MPTFISKITWRNWCSNCCNETKFKPYGDLVNEACSGYNAIMFGNQDLFGRIENDETRGLVHSIYRENENTGSSRNSAVPNFMPRIMTDNEILEIINSLVSKQCDVFNTVHSWTKEYPKHKGVSFKSIHIFLFMKCRHK